MSNTHNKIQFVPLKSFPNCFIDCLQSDKDASNASPISYIIFMSLSPVERSKGVVMVDLKRFQTTFTTTHVLSYYRSSKCASQFPNNSFNY